MYRLYAGAFVIVALATTACAVRQPRPATYRYVNHILIPPGVKDAKVSQRKFTIPTTANCSSPEDGVLLHRGRRSTRVTVDRQALVAHPPGWLSAWGASLEKQGCLPVGEGLALANRIAEMLPLDPKIAYDLLHASMTSDGYIDLGPEHRLKVTSPILRQDAESNSVAIGSPRVSGQDGKLTVEMRASPDFLGYETAWYAVEPYANRVGTQIVPISIEDHIDGNTSRPDKPRFNYFQFGADAAYYRLFYLTRLSQADHDIDLLAAPTRAGLEEQTKRLETDPGVCAQNVSRTCAAVPREIAVTPYVLVTVNGLERTIPIGGTVRAALKAAGVSRAEGVLPTLQVQRRYAGRLTPVIFDRARPEILDLLLTGREEIRWSTPSPLGKLVDAGGYRVHLYCTGAGSPTVMIVGAGFSFDWGLVQPEIAKFTRVCTYDPAGTAWSDPGPELTCLNRVSEIHSLLKNAGNEGPYVLVGLSIGGLVARLYASQHRNEVAGMVIVDHAFLNPVDDSPPRVSQPSNPGFTPPVLLSKTPIDATVEDISNFNNLPERYRELHRWAAALNPAMPTAGTAEKCIAQVEAATQGRADALGNLPLIVVSTANDSPNYAKLQARLLALSHNSKQLIAEKSFHSVEIDQPEVVISAIRQVIEARRKAIF